MAIVSAHRLHLHSVHAPLVPPDILQSSLPSKYHPPKKMLDRPDNLEQFVATEII